MNTKKEITVRAIESGTVIDHIPANRLFKILSILGIENIDTEVVIGNNFVSNKLGKKGIIKIEKKFPSIQDINKISILAPNAIINIIRDYQVVEKKKVEVPTSVEGIVKCVNPKCVTNHENVKTNFKVINKDGKISLKCHYCEKITDHKNLKIV